MVSLLSLSNGVSGVNEQLITYNIMKIWHISDTHCYHNLLKVPSNIDMVIFSGDCSNPRDPYTNEHQVRQFIEWYFLLNIPIKIFVAGNHDTSIERKLILKEDFQKHNIIYLENESIVINELKIFGSPYTPSFGYGWSFNKNRNELENIWKNSIDKDVNIIITHGPPIGILDLTYNQYGKLERCGDVALLKRVMKVNPKLCVFGHIHNCRDINNQRTMKIGGLDTTFSNGSVMKDDEFGRLTSNGNIIYI
jgi:Icc-related predicted phosphoesterase